MEPVKNIGTADYAMSVPASQIQAQNYTDYSSMPMVYEPEVEEKKKASSNMLGMTMLGIIAAAGVGYGIYKGKGVKNLKNQITDLTAQKDQIAKQLDDANAKIKELENSKKKGFWTKVKEKFSRKKKVETPETKPEAKTETKTENTTDTKPKE